MGTTELMDIRVVPGTNVASVVPRSISSDRVHTIYLRVRKPILEDALLRLGDLHQRKVRALVPAEVATIKAAPRFLEDFHGDVLRIDATPVAEGDA